MAISTVELAQARDTVQEILEEMEVGSYGFDVEPAGRDWEVALEFVTDGGWRAIELKIPRAELQRARDNPGARRALLDDWRNRL